MFAVRQWLAAHGDPAAAKRRRQALARIESNLRAALEVERMKTTGDDLDCAVAALIAATKTLPQRVDLAKAAGTDPRASLRPSYLKVHEAWGQFLKIAQDVGIAKTIKRSPRKAAI